MVMNATVGGLNGKFFTNEEYNQLREKVLENNKLIRELQQDLGILEDKHE